MCVNNKVLTFAPASQESRGIWIDILSGTVILLKNKTKKLVEKFGVDVIKVLSLHPRRKSSDVSLSCFKGMKKRSKKTWKSFGFEK